MHYFGYESHIIIDTKSYESDNNCPLISLVIDGFFENNEFLDKATNHLNVSNEMLFNKINPDVHFNDIYIH